MSHDVVSEAPCSPIRRVSVLGLGTMGHGIVQSFAVAGYEVVGFDDVAAARDSLKTRIQANLEQFALKGLFDRQQLEQVLSRITISDSLAQTVRDSEFVTEAVREDLPTKQALFAELESLVTDRTILASNTSSYPMTDISVRMQRPQRAINTHWFNPPHIIPLVEVVPGKQTDDATTQTSMQLLKAIGKQPVRLNQEVPGFLVNRVQVAMMREIWDLWERGVASAEDIDLAIRTSIGLRLAVIGPMQVCDFAGLDIWSKVYSNLAPDLRSSTTLHDRVQTLVAAGHFGAKTQHGLYVETAESLQQKMTARDSGYLDLIKLFHQPTADS